MHTDSNTCYQSDHRLIEVLPLPSARFVVDTLVCTNTSVSFAASASGNLSYAWDFGDGTGSVYPTPSMRMPLKDILPYSSSYRRCGMQRHGYANRACHQPTASTNCGFAFHRMWPLNGQHLRRRCLSGTTYAWDLDNGNTSTLASPGNVLYPSSA